MTAETRLELERLAGDAEAAYNRAWAGFKDAHRFEYATHLDTWRYAQGQIRAQYCSDRPDEEVIDSYRWIAEEAMGLVRDLDRQACLAGESRLVGWDVYDRQAERINEANRVANSTDMPTMTELGGGL